MRVNRQEFLKSLESVVPGLTSKETIGQSSYFVFQDEKVRTFNDEIACLCDTPLDITGAVSGKSLLAMLRKMPDDEIGIEVDGGEFIVKGKSRRKASFRMEEEIEMPIEEIEIPEEWSELNEEFSEAIGIVHKCVSNDESNFILTCVHIHPEYVEGMDDFQSIRYPVSLGLKKSILVRQKALKGVVGVDANEFSETESWIHFRNQTGLVLSCRRYVEEYPDLSKLLEASGKPIKLPNRLDEVIGRAEIFSSENIEDDKVVSVELKSGRIKLEGIGSTGHYTEVKQVEYDGPVVKFTISPSMLLEVIKCSGKCLISPGKLMVKSDKFTFVACTMMEKEDE